MTEILRKIYDDRVRIIAEKGFTLGKSVPEERITPLVKPDTDNLTICEIKRGSPSEGMMNGDIDPAAVAGVYFGNGAAAVSILTEENHFYGSLDDLISVKKQFPDKALLRKDFLIYPDEVDVSYRAGADLILIITAMFMESPDDFVRMEKLYKRTIELGMTPLVEVHDENELNYALRLNPVLIGINSRNLNTFKIDTAYPYALKCLIPTGIKVIYESGITGYNSAFNIGASGFNGVLVGSSIIKSGDFESKSAEIIDGFLSGRGLQNGFLTRIFNRVYNDRKTFIKICGITTPEDAEAAVRYGADCLGFICVRESKRYISADKIIEICTRIGSSAAKVAVLTEFDRDLADRLSGFVDAFQFHGDSINDNDLKRLDAVFYRAVNVKSPEDIDSVKNTPFLLLDAYSASGEKGGTGERIAGKIIDGVKGHLYLAGGINCDNAAEIVTKYRPAMIDVSSGIESAPGVKDHKKMENLIKIIRQSEVIDGSR